MNISPATINDTPKLVKLVNSGYRGEASKKGWTTEADLLEGDLRIDLPSLQDMLNGRGAALLKAESNDGDIVGCVYLQKQEKGLYLGLLTVSPELQAGGIGKQLLAASEIYARENDCPCIFMRVISRRVELVAWYERHGYQKTGETNPFPTDQQFGIPTAPLEFIILKKVL
jgi:ribosomal protein S18 acetylase RimI-like enzyme